MKIQDYLAGKHDCACGKDHPCDIRFVEIGKGVLDKLSVICADFSHILLVADGNTFPLCGEKVLSVLGNKIYDRQIFGKETVVPDEDSIAQIEAHLDEKTDLILGIGSGVINDLCKYTSFFHSMRYVIVATAPSMDGYASVGAAMILKQMKETVNARVPFAIVAEAEVVSTAPLDLIRSGYGDIVGKYSCLNDWKLAHLIKGEYFCQYVYDVIMGTVKRVEGTAEALLRRDPDAMATLTESLVLVGVMMSYVGNSRPASGSEHHFAHFFEITGLLDHRPYYLHGIDVLYSAALTAKLREEITAMKPPFAPFVLDRKAWEKKMHEIYTTAADNVIRLQDKIGNYATLDTAQFAKQWDEIVALLKEAPSYDQMKTYVDAIGLNMDTYYAFYGKTVLDNAIAYAKDLKDRYTVLWLYNGIRGTH